MKVLIIGAGLFGSVARDVLAEAGIESIVIDNGEELAGSKAAGCLIKPSWLTKLPKAEMEAGLYTLDRLYGLRSMPLRGPAGLPLGTILHAPPSRILRGPDIVGTVAEIDHNRGYVRMLLDDQLIRGDAILVAAGIWSSGLLPRVRFEPWPKIEGLYGESFRFSLRDFDGARLKVWAPYKQSVAFTIAPAIVWFGDGTAIKNGWDGSKYRPRALEHAESLDPDLNQNRLLSSQVGIRPYVKGKVGWYERLGQRSWLSTGGAKNGVVLAAVQAQAFLRDLREHIF